MGSGQSVRATHFQRPDPPGDDHAEDIPDDHHISISNKMVERLVEDATVAAGAPKATVIAPRGDYKDKILMERIKRLDDSHSARTGLTLEEMTMLANRIDFRTSNMVSVDPVCAEFKSKVIDCYANYELPEDNFKCWDAVGEFSSCVQEASAARLRARTQREAREQARRSRHMALARQHELRDLGPGPRPPTSV